MTPEELAALAEKMKKGEKLTEEELASLNCEESAAKSEKKEKRKFRLSKQDIIGEFFDSVKEIIVRKGKLTSDPIQWEFYIEDKVLKIDGQDIEKYKIFSTVYINTFLRPAPDLKNPEWKSLLGAFAEEGKIEFKNKSTESEESENEYIANRIFELICKLPIVEDDSKVDAGIGRALLNYQGYYCIPSKCVDKIIDSTSYHITKQALMETMTELKMKKGGNERVRYGEVGQQWSYWFIKASVDEMKGSVSND